jgi:hypothetical protein
MGGGAGVMVVVVEDAGVGGAGVGGDGVGGGGGAGVGGAAVAPGARVVKALTATHVETNPDTHEAVVEPGATTKPDVHRSVSS